MKSYFKRFLHPTTSHSNGKPQSTPILSYSGLTRISRSNKFATWFDLDTPIKSECDILGKSASTGRSMVEMLGVLAIIGVLSVGAIAGYSKAMMKYKLNKHSEAVNMLINNVLSLYERLPHIQNGNSTSYGKLLYKMGMLPDGIVCSQTECTDNELKDIFKNRIYIAYDNSPWTDSDGTTKYSNSGYIKFSFNSASVQDVDICRNIIFTAKENSANIYLLRAGKIAGDNTSVTLYGDSYCNNTDLCLKNLNLNKSEELCGNCKNNICYVTITFRSY